MAVKIFNVINKGIRIRENGVFTAPELISDAGVFFEEAGGYYAGGNIIVDGKEYAIFVEPNHDKVTKYTWKSPAVDTLGANSTYNGKQNTQAMIDSNIDNHPAAKYCVNLVKNGFDDWHLPSPDELEVCYRFLKPTTRDNYLETSVLHNQMTGYNPNSNPTENGYTQFDPTQTTVLEFQNTNSEAFVSVNSGSTEYWTSMQHSSANGMYTAFFFGRQHYDYKGVAKLVRAVRWIEV